MPNLRYRRTVLRERNTNLLEECRTLALVNPNDLPTPKPKYRKLIRHLRRLKFIKRRRNRREIKKINGIIGND